MNRAERSVLKRVFRQKCYLLYFVAVWFITMTIFIWLININLLTYIVISPLLSVAAKLQFIAESYGNYFRYLDSPIAWSMVALSLLVALNFTLVIYLWREGRRRSDLAKSNAGALTAMIGSHCISCGTSLVAPLVTAFAGTGVFLSAERAAASQMLAVTANVIGMLIILWSIKKVSQRIYASNL